MPAETNPEALDTGGARVRVENLSKLYPITKGAFRKATDFIHAVDGISFQIRRGETIGVVGESGSGKSVTALSIMRLIPQPPGRIVEGEIRYNGRSLLELPPAQMRKVRGKEISLEARKQVQISTVLTDYRATSIKRVMDELVKDLGPRGIAVTGTELIGLTTQEALTNYAVEALGVKDFNPDVQVLETKLLKLLGSWQTGANLFVDALSNTEPTPGGGSAAAISGAMGCALGQMAIGISLRSKKLDEARKPGLRAGGVDSNYCSFRVKKYHVQRDKGVFHPKGLDGIA